jgi:hypothetical protein
MKTRKRCLLFIVCSLLVFALAGCGSSEPPLAATRPDGSVVEISFDYERQSGMATNQFVIWVEDMDGNYVKTVCGTNFAARGGYESRPEAVPVWVEKSNAAAMSNEQIDAISGATPQTGTQTYYWDLTDDSGKPVDAGEYIITVEGNLRWKNRVVYVGIIEVGGGATQSEAIGEISHEESGGNAALGDGAEEDNMITSVMVKYIPKEY